MTEPTKPENGKETGRETGEETGAEDFPPVAERPSPNRGPRPPGTAIDTLVLHYTGMRSAAEALDRLCDPAAKVSAHYAIGEDGTVWRLVPEALRAWHAGVSFWRGESNLNDRSIGIELVNPGHEFGYRPFPEPQMAALIALCRGILARHPIPPGRVVGHSDIAPTRKQDPGELFDWKRLAAAGIGAWPRIALLRAPASVGDADTLEAVALLGRIGYDTGALEGESDGTLIAAFRAFQRRFRPARVDGILDGETLLLLRAAAECTG
jgi:N-acetylmuramoyl-L-alanine amidase